MNRFEPIHDAHAIEQVALVVQFFEPVNDDARFSQILEVGERFREELPGGGVIPPLPFALPVGFNIPFMPMVASPGINVQVPAQRPQVLSGLPPAAGLTLSATRRDGVIEAELRLDRRSIAFRSAAYTSWKRLWTQVGKYFEHLVPLYAESSLVAAIGLTYLDKFYWSGGIENVRVAGLLREGSDYVAPHIFAVSDLWHTHTGAFIKVDDETKRLLNVNVDSADESSNGKSRRVVTIGTVLTDMFNQPGYRSRAFSTAESASVCAKHFNMLHTYNKQIMKRTLNDEMCKRIGLVG